MSAAETLREARTAGIDLRVEGGELVLQAPAQPPADLLERLTRHKPEIVAMLRSTRDGWSVEDWQAHFDERAGIAEFEGGLPRPEAEARAFDCCVVEWMDHAFERSPPGRCCACGGGDHIHDVLVPNGAESTGHVWLHSRCRPAWHAGRKAEAVATLKVMGIVSPAKFRDDFGKNGGA